MQNLIDYSQNSPALLAGHPFTNVQNDWYWTSTDFAPDTTYAWLVNLDIGTVYAYGKAGADSAWAVR